MVVVAIVHADKTAICVHVPSERTSHLRVSDIPSIIISS